MAVGVVAFWRSDLSAQPLRLGPEFQINTQTIGIQAGATIAQDSSGNFIVVWASGENFSAFDVFGQQFNSLGDRIGENFQVNSYTPEFQAPGPASFDIAGNFVVVWYSYGLDGERGGISSQRFSSAGAPLGEEFIVNSYTLSSQYAPAICHDSKGGFIVSWTSDFEDGDNTGVFGRRFDGDGLPQGPDFQVNVFTALHQSRSRLSCDALGNTVVVWDSSSQESPNHRGVFARLLSSTGRLGPEFQVNQFTPGHQDNPSVSHGPEGEFVIVWQSMYQDGDLDGVFGRRFAGSGAPLGPEFQMNMVTVGSQYAPIVSHDASGSFLVVWNSIGQDGGAGGLFARWFDSAGQRQGNEFQVNTYTPTYQQAWSLTPSRGDQFVIVRDSYDQDGDRRGVFGQRFLLPKVVSGSGPDGGSRARLYLALP
jgi:hypothetical protein